MPHDAYELIAQTARYFFAALMLLIVIRAARITLVDSRRAARLRRLSPMTGIVGELVVLEGDERARRGMRYPAIREGAIGSGRSADIRIRHSSVRRLHAYFQMTENGLYIRSHEGAKLRAADGSTVQELLLTDGANFGVGRVHLLLVLSEATANEEIVLVPRKHEEYDELFDPEPAGPYERRDEFRRIRREVGRQDAPSRDPYDFPGEGRQGGSFHNSFRPQENPAGIRRDPYDFPGEVRQGGSFRDTYHPQENPAGIRRDPYDFPGEGRQGGASHNSFRPSENPAGIRRDPYDFPGEGRQGGTSHNSYRPSENPAGIRRDPYDFPGKGRQARSDRIRQGSHPFDEAHRPSGSRVQEGIRRTSADAPVDPDRLFDADDDLF